MNNDNYFTEHVLGIYYEHCATYISALSCYGAPMMKMLFTKHWGLELGGADKRFSSLWYK